MSAPQGTRGTGLVRILVTLARRPHLWATALRVARSHMNTLWWKRWPFLPRPAGAYLTFRMETQYGDQRSLTAATADDVMEYLMWVKTWRRS